jgi:hypothetical protein
MREDIAETSSGRDSELNRRHACQRTAVLRQMKAGLTAQPEPRLPWFQGLDIEDDWCRITEGDGAPSPFRGSRTKPPFSLGVAGLWRIPQIKLFPATKNASRSAHADASIAVSLPDACWPSRDGRFRFRCMRTPLTQPSPVAERGS